MADQDSELDGTMADLDRGLDSTMIDLQEIFMVRWLIDCWLMAPEKSWCLVECPARWEPQEERVMNIAARFSLS
jgi:hypothetical protein